MSKTRKRLIKGGKVKAFGHGQSRPKKIPFKGRKHTKKTKKIMSKKAKLRIGEKNSFYGKHHSKKTKETIGNKCHKRWQNKEYREKIIKSSLKGLMKRPTSLEIEMIKIIEKNKLPYTYVGDGSFLVGYKNPDFVNTNGEKICVEVANTIHHDKNYEGKRIKYFAEWGWKCIVFWTNKLNEKEVIKKIGETNANH